MPPDRKPGAFLAPQDDPAFLDVLADVLESDRRFQQLAAVKFCDTVDQMGCRDGTRHAALPSPAFDKIVDEHRNQLVRIDEFASFVENSEAIRIAVGRKTKFEPVL